HSTILIAAELPVYPVPAEQEASPFAAFVVRSPAACRPCLPSAHPSSCRSAAFCHRWSYSSFSSCRSGCRRAPTAQPAPDDLQPLPHPPPPASQDQAAAPSASAVSAVLRER